jgi:hypothetical protein
MKQLLFIRFSSDRHIRVAYKPMRQLWVRQDKHIKGLYLACVFGLCVTVWL